MLVVDVAGDAYPSIGHAAWDGLHLADFVMPYFLLISGISAALSPAAGLQCQLDLSDRPLSLPSSSVVHSLAVSTALGSRTRFTQCSVQGTQSS